MQRLFCFVQLFCATRVRYFTVGIANKRGATAEAHPFVRPCYHFALISVRMGKKGDRIAGISVRVQLPMVIRQRFQIIIVRSRY